MANVSNSAQKRTLRPRHQKFVEEYLRCWNASEAARRTGYKKKSNVIGSELVANSSIRAEITKRIAETAMSADEVLLRLGQHARSEWSDYMNDDGSIDIAGLKEAGRAHLIHKTKISKRTYKDGSIETTGEVEFYDAQAALVHIGRHLALFLDKSAGSDAVYRDHMDQLRRTIVDDEPTETKRTETAEPSGSAVQATPASSAST